MKKIIYTPDAADKLRWIHQTISIQFGEESARKVSRFLTQSIRNLSKNEELGSSVQAMFAISSDYRYLFVGRHYVFYHIGNKYIKIINIYNECEDFMWQLFGVDTTPPETTEYWNE